MIEPSAIRTAMWDYRGLHGVHPNIVYLSPEDANEISKMYRPEFVNYPEKDDEIPESATVMKATIQIKESLLPGETLCDWVKNEDE